MRAFVVCLVLAAAHEAHAGACGGFLSVKAAGPELARDGLVLLDTLEVDVVTPVLDKATFVTADGTALPAKVVKRAGSEYHLQVLFAPQHSLPAKTTVHLAFGLKELDKDLAERTLTTSDASMTDVHWAKAPRALRRYQESSNKGDSYDAYRVKLALDAPTFVVAEMTYANKTSASEIYVGAGEILVGTTGCHTILVGNTGVVTFTAIGSNGEVAAPGKPLKLRY
ncbi:MAG TPA: hypothetical protein VGM90_02600 [Kofleriaceae bacterium]|jgi:hypothetical protein